jgi:hypothetical protein
MSYYEWLRVIHTLEMAILAMAIIRQMALLTDHGMCMHCCTITYLPSVVFVFLIFSTFY